MNTVAHNVYLDSERGALTELPAMGTSLENPYVYDACARELKDLASSGLLRVVEERRTDAGSESLISRLTFRRVR